MSGKPESLDSAEFKAEVALAALAGGQSDAELADRFGVAPAAVREWRSHLRARAAKLFEGGGVAETRAARRRRLETEQVLRESEQLFRLLTDGIPHIVWLTDPDGRFEFLNRRFTEFTGLAFEPMAAEDLVRRVVHPEDKCETLRVWQGAVAARQPFLMEHRLRAAIGEYRWCTAHAVPQFDEETGEILRWFGTTTDVHDQKVAEDALRKANAQLLESDRRKDEFLAMLAHELRTPLASLRVASELLERPGTDPATASRMREVSRRQVTHLSRLVDDLLDVSRITRGIVELRPERLNLSVVVERALESVRMLMEEKRHEVELTLPREPLWVMADPARLEQIAANLLTNAGKYTNAGGRIEVEVRRCGDSAELRVRDTGIGIAPEVLEHVFDLFGQAERGLARSEGGLGIGLTVVKNLVEMHGGRVEAYSDGLGHGAEFAVTFPAVAAAADAVGQRESTSVPDRGSERCVLIVDDNADAAETLAALLETSGHNVALAHDGPSALAKAEAIEPQVALLDIGLPGMDGYELARRLRRNARTAATVLAAVSGYGQPRDRERAEEAGFDAYFVKPVDVDALSAFVEGAEANARHHPS